MGLESEDLFGDFLEESNDIIESVYTTLRGFANLPDRQSGIEAVFRGIHTIKGASSMFSMERLHQVAHLLESKLSNLKNDLSSISEEVITQLLLEVDKIFFLLNNQDQEPPAADTAGKLPILQQSQLGFDTRFFGDFYDQFAQMLEEFFQKSWAQFELVAPAHFSDKILALERVGVKLLKQKKLSEQGTAYLFYVEAGEQWDKSQKKILGPLGAMSSFHWISRPVKVTSDIVLSPTGVADKKELKKSKQQEVIRVPEERINQALDNIWELFLVRNQLSYLMSQHHNWLNERPEFIRSWELLESSLESNITELESKTMRMRMASLKSVFSRLEQIVRNYCAESGKKINFVAIGEETELDKKIIDMLSEPLTHLIRNAMNHGIDAASERAALGKTVAGTITVEAKVVGNEVAIKLTDDGRGIDPKKILASARKKKLDLSQVVTDKDAIDLIFMPGFSTAEKITGVSGRGVGMDAVRTSIQAVGGSVSVHTQVNHGSTFTISLPLSMSVISALVMKVNGQRFACTTSTITETKLVSLNELKENSGELYFLRGDKYVPCVNLKEHIFAEFQNADDFLQTIEGAVCLIETQGSHIALLVDSILDHYSLVIKPVPSNIPAMPFVMGVSILATGDPIFIISLFKLHDYILQQQKMRKT